MTAGLIMKAQMIITASVTRSQLREQWPLPLRLQTHSYLTGKKPLCSCTPGTLATLQTQDEESTRGVGGMGQIRLSLLISGDQMRR